MSEHLNINFFAIKSRIKILHNFRELIVQYFGDIKYGQFGGGGIEGEHAKLARPEINKNLAQTQKILTKAGVNTGINILRPPAAGGGRYRFDLLENVFNLQDHDVNHQSILDLIDKSIGIYQSEQRAAFVRTFNPFWWIWRSVTWISSLPFKAIGAVGFNQQSVEQSFFGKLVKLTIQTAIFAAAILQIDYYVNNGKLAATIQSLIA